MPHRLAEAQQCVGAPKQWRIYWVRELSNAGKLRYNKAGRGEAILQCKATKKTGSKVKATCNLWSFCLHLLACDICADLYSNVSLVACGKPNMGICVAHKAVCSWTAETQLRIVAWLCAKESSWTQTININTTESITFC